MTLSQGSKRPVDRVAEQDERFPGALRLLASPPEWLWYGGRLPFPKERLMAVVGARAATRVGCDKAFEIARGLARTGMTILSGGAFGIDAAAHEGALAEGGSTFAVLGCGADVVYPDRHGQLFARIAMRGGLLSEYPPGTPPRRGQFPARNRLIAALAEAVLVVEAAYRSGALITARLARSMGRPLFAVAGSPGTDELLRKGHAAPVSTAADVREILAGQKPRAPSVAKAPERFSAILDAIGLGSNSPADLCKQVGMALPSLLAALAEAELEGLVKRAAGNSYEVIGREY